MKNKQESWTIKSISLLLTSVFYFLTRLINLTSLPIFADEAIYVRWSQIIKNVETLRFIPLTDGKQPLFMWLTVPFLSFFKDPLIAARFLSILSGFINLIFIFLISSLIYYKPKKVSKNPLKHVFKSVNFSYYYSLATSFIYIILPFALFFDRLATPDNLLSSLVLASTFLTILQFNYYRLDISLLMGVCLGLAWLTKSPALYFITLTCLSLVIYSFFSKSKKPLIVKLFHSLLPAVIATVFYFTLKLGPQFHMIAIRNKDYIWPITEVLKHPLDPLKPHFMAVFSLYKYFVSLPIILVFLTGLVLSIKNFTKNYILIFLLSLFLIPIFATTFLAKVFTGRYILFSLPFFVILLTYFFTYIPQKVTKNRLLIPILFLIFFIPNLILINKILFAPSALILPSTETGYLNDWTSGWGIEDISIYLKDRSKQANVIVGTEGHFGSLPDGLQVYTDGTPNLTIIGLGVHLSQIPENLIDAYNHGDEVYLLINTNRHFLDQSELSKLQVIKSYTRPDNTQLVLYQLIGNAVFGAN